MFEEVCLVCGKHLCDDGRAYCSSECENHDMSSPSMSSASSVLSSPHLGSVVGGDVPPLLPSALGVALKKRRTGDRYSISSSSASSTTWSISTEDEDEEPVLGINTDYSQTDGIEQVYEVGPGHPMWPSGLSYTRLPSGTNNRSTVPHLQNGPGSVSPGHVRGTPRSVPTCSHSSAGEEEAKEAKSQSAFGFSSRDSSTPFSDNGLSTINAKSKRPRNRASLPAYFSLLQISNSGQEAQPSPVSSASNHTIACHSPPTPKLIFSAGVVQPHLHADNLQVTPRGRRRIPGSSSRVTCQSGYSGSRSRSRSRTQHNASCTDMLIDLSSQQHEIRDVVRHTLNWASDPCTSRGRSSPHKMQLGKLDSHTALRRGRLRMEELDGYSPDAPGYGHGRSGLVDRERAIGTRTTYY